MKNVNISEGMNLHLLRTDKFNTVTIVFLIRRKLSKDEVTLNALIPKVLIRGCEKYPSSKSISIKTEMMFGASVDTEIMKKGDEQIIELYMEVYDKKDTISEAIEFAKEILLKPLVCDGGFNEDYVNSEKANLYNEIKSRINDKKEYAKQRCIELMFKNEPFGLYGDGYIEDLDSINRMNLYEHYKKILQESPMEIMVLGNVSQEFIIDKLKEQFSEIERNNTINICFEKSNLNVEAVKGYKEKIEVNQGKLCMGFRTGILADSNDYFALLVGNEILGGGANSKLFANVREKQSLCYYINSIIFRFKSTIFIQSGIENKDYQRVSKMIVKEVNNVKRGGFTRIDLANAKKTLINNFLAMADYNNMTMDFYTNQIIIDDKKDIKDFVSIINGVSKRDVISAFENVKADTVYFLGGENWWKRLFIWKRLGMFAAMSFLRKSS